MRVNICGIPYKVKYKNVINEGNAGICEGEINYSKQRILLREGLPQQIENETLTHEMVHGMLCHLGYTELCNDETFVQGLANAISQGFKIKVL